MTEAIARINIGILQWISHLIIFNGSIVNNCLLYNQ